MSKIFYCNRCKTLDYDFYISRAEERIRQTWVNLRDGYGGTITHLICPHCGYVLSGYINWHGDKIDEGIVSYVKHSIEIYSDKEYEGSFLKVGAIDFLCNDIMDKKRNQYKQLEDEKIKNIIESMRG